MAALSFQIAKGSRDELKRFDPIGLAAGARALPQIFELQSCFEESTGPNARPWAERLEPVLGECSSFYQKHYRRHWTKAKGFGLLGA